MTKRVIEAKAALQDIRLGMSDLELKIKYRLSSKGLRSLFRNLDEAGLLKYVNPRQVQRDLRSGLSDSQLVDKYLLTRSDLRDLLKQVERLGLLRYPVEEDGVTSCTFSRVAELVNDIRSGMGRTELMKKFRLSGLGLRWVSMMLVGSGAINLNEIYDRICMRNGAPSPGMIRSHRRYPVQIMVQVRDLGQPERLGRIRDMSRSGVGVLGLPSSVGETRTLVVTGDEFGEHSTFILDVTTKWLSAGPNGDTLTGFGISNISLASMAEFNILLELVRLDHLHKTTSLPICCESTVARTQSPMPGRLPSGTSPPR
jgi:hypothetical protein